MTDYAMLATEFARDYANGSRNGMPYIRNSDQGRAYRGVVRKLKAEGAPSSEIDCIASEAIWMFTLDDQR